MSTKILTAVIDKATVALPADLPNPSPDWGFLGTDAGISIYNGLYAWVLIACGIAGLVGVFLLIFGKVGQHQGSFTAGLWTVGAAVVGAALATGIAVLINWGAGLQLGS